MGIVLFILLPTNLPPKINIYRRLWLYWRAPARIPQLISSHVFSREPNSGDWYMW